MCFYCEKQFHQRETLKQHQKYDCVLRPPEPSQQSAYRTRRSTQAATTSQPRSRPLEVVKVIPRKPLRLVEEAVVFPAKGVYIESLDLLPQAKAERVRRQSLGKKINCSVIEVEASRPAKTPATPRTPKSLISQLSRDASPPGRVRLLSRDGSPPSARTKLRMSDCEEEAEGRGQKEGGSDNESECSKSENGEDKYRPRRVATLLNIDLSSPLGGRVNKHISEYYDNNESDSADDDDQSESLVNNTYEDFCRTPTKSNDTGRLRSRGDFQVTFKKTKRTAAKFAHQYKFRRAELSEFCRVVETGLNRRSRALKREMKKCRIMVERLSEADITRWGSSSKQMSRQKHADVQRWVSGCDSSSSASFGQFDYLRSLLTRDTVPRVDHRSKEHYVYQTMRQNIGGARGVSGGARGVSGGARMASGARVASSAADLTPPHTPEALPGLDDDDVIMLDDMSSPHAPPPTCPTTPQKQPRKTPLTPRKWVDDGDTRLDDVISISSTESDSELKVISPECLKRAANFSPAGGELPVKHRRIEALRPAALLFRCHLCYQEITCHDGANIYIKQHFAASHNVYNIDLIEHLDAVGQKVVSIVEVPIPSAVQVASPPTTLKVDPTPQPRATQFKSAAGKVTKTAPTKTVASKTSKPTVLKAANKPGSNAVKSSKQKAEQVKPVVAARKVASTKANKPQPKAKVQAKKAAGAKSLHLQNKSTSKTIANNTATATSKSQPKGSAKKLQTVQSNNSKSPVAKNGSKSKIVKRASSASTKTGCLLKVKLKVKPVKRR